MQRTELRRARRAALASATMLAGLALPAAALAQAGVTWATPGGDPQGTRFSSLNEINASNVGSLVEDFSVPTNTFQNHEGAPLVVNDTMYIETPFPNNLIAVDLRKGAKYGKVEWVYTPNTDPGSRAQACCDFDNRGAAYASAADGAPTPNGLIIFNSLDGFVHGVDAVTGALVWKTQVASIQIAETTTGAPIIADGIAMVGNSGAEDGVRGAVYGINITNGALAWKAYNTGPDSDVLIGPGFHAYYAKDQGTNLGVTSWNGSAWWKQGGATAWGYKTYDPVLDLFYYGTGNAEPWSAVARGGQGNAQWAGSIMARRPKTGELIWAYQVNPDDTWDYDSIAESPVLDIKINGVNRHVLFHMDKNGFAYTLDAATGQVLEVGNATPSSNNGVPTTTTYEYINTKTGYPKVTPGHYIRGIGPARGIKGPSCPTGAGIKDPEPVSYSFQTGLVYLPLHNSCSSAMEVPFNFIEGVPFTGNTSIPNVTYTSPGSPGFLVAWNPATAKPAWTNLEPYPLWSGVLSTAGDLVFYGTLSNGTDAYHTPTFKAVNARTGALLWSAALECNTVGSPMAYMGADGHERIAMFTGTGNVGNAGTGKCPNLTIFNPVGRPPLFDKSPTSTWLGVTSKKVNQAAQTVTTGYLHVFKLP